MNNYLIYDAALNGTYTLLMLQKHYPKHRCLFKGTKDETLVDVAPHIFLIDDSGEKLKDEIELSLKELVTIESIQDIDTVKDHFKEFIYQDVNRRECFFRFWDPRVLKKFLPMCTEIQLKMFFRPVTALIMADENDSEVVRYTLQYSGLVAEKAVKAGLFPVFSALTDAVVAG